MRSYYLTLNLIEADRFEYSLFVPMTPLGQPSMRALAVAGNDGDSYGRIIVYNCPKGTLVYGPEQVDAFIKQDPGLSQELTLWSQQGSQATRGRMIVVSVEGVVTYIQGIFLQETDDLPLPQLAQIIVSQGPMVVMASSLEEGFESLHALIRETEQEELVQEVPPRDEPPEATKGAAKETSRETPQTPSESPQGNSDTDAS